MGPSTCHLTNPVKGRPMATASHEGPLIDCPKIPSRRPTCHKKKGTIRRMQKDPGDEGPLNPCPLSSWSPRHEVTRGLCPQSPKSPA